MSSSAANPAKNQETKKRKIEIKEVEQTDRRNVTFSKRKLGLFNKLTELSVLCQVDTAMIITSQNGKFFTCGYPNADTVIHRYMKRGSSSPNGILDRASKQEMIETLRLEYEATQNQLKEEKKYLQEITETQNNSSCFLSWWNLSTENMSLENLQQFNDSLERLKSSLVAALEGKRLNLVPSIPSSSSSTSFVGIDHMYSPLQATMVPPMTHPLLSTSQFANMSSLPQNFGGNHVQEFCMNDASTSSLPVSGFGHRY